MTAEPKRVREQAVVYMSGSDRELLERLVEETGFARTELFRRGLRRLADELLAERAPGSSVDYLTGIADATDAPADAVSFEVLRTGKLTAACAFDRHFEVAGFELLGELPDHPSDPFGGGLSRPGRPPRRRRKAA